MAARGFRPLPSDAGVAAFAQTMPASYRATYDHAAVAAHATIAGARGADAARVARWRDRDDGSTALCIVAEDRPGLLSRITAALVATAIDVVAADAYCRVLDSGVVEAVDLLWIQRVTRAGQTAEPIDDDDVAAISELVIALVRGDAKTNPPPPTLGGGTFPTRVRFEEGGESGSTVVTVEAIDRPGLLAAVAHAIFRARMQIVALRARTEQGRAIDRFEVIELDGRALDGARRLALQTAILGAIEAAPSGPTLEPA